MATPPPYPGIPRWMKIFGVLVGVLMLLALVHRLAIGGHVFEGHGGAPVSSPSKHGAGRR